jgi:hypothetical protein
VPQITCFTGAEVQILTPEARQVLRHMQCLQDEVQVLLLASPFFLL